MSSPTIRIAAIVCSRCKLMQAPATTGLCVSCASPRTSGAYQHVPRPDSTPTIPVPAK